MKNKKNSNLIKNQLKSHYGIGKTQSQIICNLLGISSNLRIKQLTQYENNFINLYIKKRIKIIDNYLPQKAINHNHLPISDNLKYLKKNNISSLIDKNCYRGFRLKRGLPVRGQRTHTNAQTSKKLSRYFK